MRERSTWNLQEIAVAKTAADRRAAEAGDIYSMNQDHPQPAMDEYVIGDPSDFAEDVHSPNTWEAEYASGQTKRNEIGMPDMRKDTFKTAADDRVRLKKAELCVAVAKLMLAGQRVASIDAVEDQAYALMYMPDQELINTHKRLAADEDDDEGDDDEGGFEEDSDEGQDKQAGEIPPQFKENIEKMKAKSNGGGDDDDDDDDDDDGGQDKQANDDQFEEDVDEDEDVPAQKQAKSKSKTSQGLQEPKNEGGDQNSKANDNWPTKKANQQQLAQMQQMMSQLQQMIQQAQGEQQLPLQAQGQGQQLLDQEPVLAEGDDLEQMLAQDPLGPMAETDIELEPAPMDDNVVLASDDEILRTLFAQDEQVEEEEVQQAVQQQKPQQKQALRTASTRTVGTRPTSGVSKLGGSGSRATRIEDKLSALWQSAPDVRDAFGLK